MQQWQEALNLAGKSRRCTAKTRQGVTCKSPAMVNSKCRMHGGASTGAPCGEKHGRYKHGRFTKSSIAKMAWINAIIRDSKELMQQAEELV